MTDERTYRYGQPITEIIRKRHSVRTYDRRPISVELREAILQYAQQLKGPFPMEVQFGFLDKPKVKVDAQIKLGTYGMIQGASSFIAAAVEKKEHNMEQLGYVFEDLILYLTSLGLGTCWLAGTFNKGAFSKAMKTGPDELLPIVSPVGYKGWLASPIDGLLKPLPNLKVRKTWNKLFYANNFNNPLKEAEAGLYALPLEMVRLAPSASNRQPWRVILANERYHFYLAHDAIYKTRYPYDIQKIDLGIAMFHFEAVAKEAGLPGRWETQEPNLGSIPPSIEYIVTWVPE